MYVRRQRNRLPAEVLEKKARLFCNGILESVPVLNIEVSKRVTDHVRIIHSLGGLAYDVGHHKTVILGRASVAPGI